MKSKNKILLSSLLLASCSNSVSSVNSQGNPETKVEETASEEQASNSQKILCPEGMANIEDKFCIDRYEASIIDQNTGAEASPHYMPTQELIYDADWQYNKFKSLDNLPMPLRGAEQNPDFKPAAVSQAGKIPATYIGRYIAEQACDYVGKRLCSHQEWYKACVGPNGPAFKKNKQEKLPEAYPYGLQYQSGKCNLGQPWPIKILGRSTNWQMKDPRLSALVDKNGLPFKRATGSFPECTNEYGVYDMVGNAHEIVSDLHEAKPFKKVTFVGSHYARPTTESCAEYTLDHGDFYTDYSVGFRCCTDITKGNIKP
ncbi:SUMF1/EgtB/PvdO family nonheme iron enzyme [Candidatus Woesearchaeota archaeon]|nr:SUMF1/EgtB/PvdO family nonheme iron enzyme [Candidatus Woesearchaeota archaeon]MBI2582266.1 SUMF1/EgtB/PvdO family nonheme iron enzyme [Candidatus Woesearchaeota archaeon]